MTERTNHIIDIVIAASSTCVSSVTAIRAIRSGYYCVVIVSKSGNFALRNKSFTASGTHLTFCKTCFGTSGRFAVKHLFSMTERTNYIIDIVIATSSTNISSISAICTIRRSYSWLVIMSKSRNLILCNKSFTTNSTYLTFCKTCFGTIRSFTYKNLFGMTKSGNSYCLARDFLSTSGTVNYVFVATGFFAIGSNVVFYYSITAGMLMGKNLVTGASNLIEADWATTDIRRNINSEFLRYNSAKIKRKILGTHPGGRRYSVRSIFFSCAINHSSPNSVIISFNNKICT